MLRQYRVREGLIFEAETGREDDAPGNLVAHGRNAPEQVERTQSSGQSHSDIARRHPVIGVAPRNARKNILIRDLAERGHFTHEIEDIFAKTQ
ncbi:MAG TPA: hypothetical protein VFA80_13580 [Xanthobacteraceae bacterium]|nr:hypothetical protein [Xanthobacteraceae bacterium]